MIRRFIQFSRALVPAILALAAGAVQAQVGHTASSIEWMTASAGAVVWASVAGVAFTPAEPPYEGSQTPWEWAAVTLDVKETLKGEPARKTSFAVRMPADEVHPPLLKVGGPPMLWFLERYASGPGESTGARRPRVEWRLQGDRVPGPGLIEPLPAEPGGVDASPRVRYPVLTLDLQLLDTDAAISAAVREQAKRDRVRRTTRSHQMTVSRSVMAGTGHHGDANALVVPADERLDRLAREWLRSSSPWQRLAGASALGSLPSRGSIELLKRLLRDPTVDVLSEYGDDGVERRVRRYYLRETAYRILSEWQVAVPKPVLREETR